MGSDSSWYARARRRKDFVQSGGQGVPVPPPRLKKTSKKNFKVQMRYPKSHFLTGDWFTTSKTETIEQARQALAGLKKSHSIHQFLKMEPVEFRIVDIKTGNVVE